MKYNLNMNLLKKLRKLLRIKRGFTLIELLVVIAIIGILASIVIISMNDARQSARDVKRVGDLNGARLSLELYFDDNGAYPRAAIAGTCENASAAFTTLGVTAADPVSTRNYFYGGNAGGTAYVLGAALEDVDASALDSGNDVDGSVLGCNCADNVVGGHTSRADPAYAYCLQP